MLAPTYPVFFDVETRTAKLTAMGDPLVKLNAWINCVVFRPDLPGCMRRKGRATPEQSPLMWCSWSKCWSSSTRTILPTEGLNARYATGSPSCVFSDDNWKTGCADSACRSMEHEEKLAADNMPSQIAIRVREGIPRRMRRRKPTRSNPMCGHWLSISLALRRKNGGHIVRTIGLMAGAGEDRDDEPGLQYVSVWYN